MSRRPLAVAAGALVLITAVLLPVGSTALQASHSFLTAMLSVVACFDVMTVYLLVGDYYDRGDARLLMMACAYGWSLVVMGGYALAFPGAVAIAAPLAVTPSVPAYLYVAWHSGFPLLLAAAWMPLPAGWAVPTPAGRRRITAAVCVGLAAAAGVGVVAVLVSFAHRLPVLIIGVNTSAMTTITAPIAIPLVLASLAVAIVGTRRRTGPERWSTVVILVCLCDLVLTYAARARYSLGWYCGRSLTVVATAVVLMAMLAEFRRLKSQAERNAAIDPLTGLFNRRSAQTALDQLVARCRRSGAALGVLSLDLDLFKQVNDRYGHETGDAALTKLGQLLASSCRYGDIVARVGGEEFLILLPDTDERATLLVAEKVRGLVADMAVPGIRERMTASLGATALRKDDLTTASLLRRVDVALYEAKGAGRDRVVVASPSAGVQVHAQASG